MKVVVKKLFCGLASVRDYKVKEALEWKEPLVIYYKDKVMTVPYETLRKNLFQIHTTRFSSKYNGDSYSLYDFKFKPDTEQQPREEQLTFF